MIRYRLQCEKAHEFEAWFGSSAAYDRQAERGQVVCPQCNSTNVSKALMAPGIAALTGRRTQPDARRDAQAMTGDDRSQHLSGASGRQPQLPAEAQKQLLAMMRHVRREVEANAEYVGPRFAEEARKIHYEEAEERRIWGEATLEEARELRDDGIDCLPLPRLPEDKI